MTASSVEAARAKIDRPAPAFRVTTLTKDKIDLPSLRGKAGYPIIDNGVPTNYVIDRAGVVRYAKAGAFDIDELEKVIVPLLKEEAPDDATPPTPAAAK